MNPEPTSVASHMTELSADTPRRINSIELIRRLEWQTLVPVLIFVGLVHVVTSIILRVNGLPVGYFPAGLLDMAILFGVASLVTPGYILGPQIAADMIRQMRGQRPTPFAERIAHWLTLAVCGASLACVFMLVLLVNANLKPAIPILNPSTFDVQLEAAERLLFGGVLPSEWLIRHSSERAIWFWDLIYDLFGTFLFVSMMIALHHEGMRGGARLILALAIGLFACLIITLLFPSRGPLFVHPEWFHRLAGTESGELAGYLRITVREYAEAPAVRYAVAGIAAMPSYHVVSWTCGLLCWRSLPRWLFAAGGVLVALNWMSTVVLGWHYVLDGAAGIALALLAFAIAGRLIPRRPDREADPWRRARDPGNAPAGATPNDSRLTPLQERVHPGETR